MSDNDETTNLRWAVGILVSIAIAVFTGIFIIVQRVEHIATLEETIIEHNVWQDKQLQSLEEHIRHLELLSTTTGRTK